MNDPAAAGKPTNAADPVDRLPLDLGRRGGPDGEVASKQDGEGVADHGDLEADEPMKAK